MPLPLEPPHLAVRPSTLLSWTDLAALVRRTAARADAGPPGGTLILAIDGFSGAGKTWVATRLARALQAPLLHVDDFIPGWDALDHGLHALAEDLVGPWARGETGRPLPYDWTVGTTGARLALGPPPVAVLEGSGIASLPPGSGLSTRIWVHTAPAVRRRRLDARPDRAAYLPHRDQWGRQEREIADRRNTPRRCDLRVLRAGTAGAQLASLTTP